jgi:hypothetical protein
MSRLLKADHVLFQHRIFEHAQQQEEAVNQHFLRDHDLQLPSECSPAGEDHMAYSSEADHALSRRRVVENLQRWEGVAIHRLPKVSAHDLQQNLVGSLVEQMSQVMRIGHLLSQLLVLVHTQDWAKIVHRSPQEHHVLVRSLIGFGQR